MITFSNVFFGYSSMIINASLGMPFVIKIDLINSTISANVDTVATGSSGAGVGVATTSSYTGATNTTGSTSTSSTSTSSSSSSSSSSGY